MFHPTSAFSHNTKKKTSHFRVYLVKIRKCCLIVNYIAMYNLKQWAKPIPISMHDKMWNNSNEKTNDPVYSKIYKRKTNMAIKLQHTLCSRLYGILFYLMWCGLKSLWYLYFNSLSSVGINCAINLRCNHDDKIRCFVVIFVYFNFIKKERWYVCQWDSYTPKFKSSGCKQLQAIVWPSTITKTHTV